MKISKKINLSGALLLLAFSGYSSAVIASDVYPNKPITIYSPFTAGGATDSLIRTMAPALSKSLGQQIVVDTRAGAGGTLAAASMAQLKKADGYQFAVAPTTLFMLPHMQKVPYDPIQDLTYVVNFAEYTMALVVPQSKPWKTVDDFVKASKESNVPLTVAIAGAGTPSHATTVLFSQKTGAKLEVVPFKGGTDVTQALKGGHVQSVLDGSWPQAVRNGDGRAIVTFSNRRLLPDVPTAKELGIDVVTVSPLGLVAPKGLDPRIAEKVQNAFKEAMEDPNFKKALVTYDIEANYMSGADYRKTAESLWVSERKNLEMLGLVGNK